MRIRTWEGVFAVMTFGILGCGGSGAGAEGAGGSSEGAVENEARSVRFHVDAVAGTATVVPYSSSSRSAFTGNSLKFFAQVLLSEGSPERRTLKVQATNNSPEPIGHSGSFRIVFTDFRNENTPLTDLRSTVKTTTILGNGLTPTSFGPLSTAKIEAPKAVAFSSVDSTVLCASTSLGRIASGSFTQVLPTAFSTVSTHSVDEFAATDKAVYLLHGSSDPTLLVGQESSDLQTDGTFENGRFTSIKDVFVEEYTNPSSFSLLIADENSIRRASVSSSNPGGSLSTLVVEAPGPGSHFGGIARQGSTYFATFGHMIKIWQSPSYRQSIGAMGSGYSDGLQSDARFGDSLGDLTIVDGVCYVADTQNNRIRQLSLIPGSSPVSPSAWWVSTLSGGAAPGGGDGSVTMTHDQPVGLSGGIGHELIVGDRGGHRVRKITPLFGRFAVGHGSTSPIPSEQACLSNPSGFCPSVPKEIPYIEEHQTIPPGKTVELTDWEFSLPEGLNAFSFLVTIEAETVSPGVMPAVSNNSTGKRGSPNVMVRGYTGRPGTGYVDGPLSHAAFNRITGMAAAQDGGVFVADQDNNAIRRIGRNGMVTTIAGGESPGSSLDGEAGTGRIQSPTGICCSPTGDRVYFTQIDALIRVAILSDGADPALRASWSLVTIAGVSFEPGTTDDTLGRYARFRSLTDIIYVSPTTLYALEDGRIRVLNRVSSVESLDSYMVSTLAGWPGVQGFYDGTGEQARFHYLTKGDLLPNGDLLVADFNNHRIRRVTPTGTTSTLCGKGDRGYLDSSNGKSALFDAVAGMAVEPSGYAYVFDVNNAVLRRISPNGSTATVAGIVGGNGEVDGSGNVAQFSPYFYSSICVLDGGDLLVSNASRIRLIQRVITN